MRHQNSDDQMTTEADAGIRFRRTLVRVMAVQVVSLLLLWLLQRHYAI